MIEYFNGLEAKFTTGYGHVPVTNQDIMKATATDLAANPYGFAALELASGTIGAVVGGVPGFGIGMAVGSVLTNLFAGPEGKITGMFNDYANIKSNSREFWDEYHKDIEAAKGNNSFLSKAAATFAASSAGIPISIAGAGHREGNLYGTELVDIDMTSTAGEIASFLLSDLASAVGWGKIFKGYKYLTGAEMGISLQLGLKDSRREFMSEVAMGQDGWDAFSSAAFHGGILATAGVLAPSGVANLFHLNIAKGALQKALPAKILESNKLLTPIERMTSGVIEGSTFMAFAPVEQALYTSLTNNKEEFSTEEMWGMASLGLVMGGLAKSTVLNDAAKAASRAELTDLPLEIIIDADDFANSISVSVPFKKGNGKEFQGLERQSLSTQSPGFKEDYITLQIIPERTLADTSLEREFNLKQTITPEQAKAGEFEMLTESQKLSLARNDYVVRGAQAPEGRMIDADDAFKLGGETEYETHTIKRVVEMMKDNNLQMVETTKGDISFYAGHDRNINFKISHTKQPQQMLDMNVRTPAKSIKTATAERDFHKVLDLKKPEHQEEFREIVFEKLERNPELTVKEAAEQTYFEHTIDESVPFSSVGKLLNQEFYSDSVRYNYAPMPHIADHELAETVSQMRKQGLDFVPANVQMVNNNIPAKKVRKVLNKTKSGTVANMSEEMEEYMAKQKLKTSRTQK